MASIRRRFDVNEGPVLDIKLARPGTIQSSVPASDPAWRTAKALLDTGANSTCVSPGIIRALRLVSRAKAESQTATGTGIASAYHLDLILPFGDVESPGTPGKRFSGLLVVQHSGGIGHEVLLGLDVLKHVILTVDGPAGVFTLSEP